MRVIMLKCKRFTDFSLLLIRHSLLSFGRRVWSDILLIISFKISQAQGPLTFLFFFLLSMFM